MPSQREQAWIESRRRMVRRWPLVGAACLLALLALAVTVWWRTPLLIDPWGVAARLTAGTLDEGMLMLMAALLPVVVLMPFGVVLVLLLFVGVSFSNERRLLDMVERLSTRDDG